MTEITKNYAAEHPVAAWKIRGSVDNIPMSSQEMLNHFLEQGTLDFKNLALHVITSMVVADTIITAIEQRNQEVVPEKRIEIDRNTTLETMVAYHASRPLAEAGVKGEATEFINEYMKTHQDTELAELLAIQNHFPLVVIQSIEEYTKARGFPRKTIGPENDQRPGTIDWNVAITQIASWSVAGIIVSMDKRFEDLIARHVNVPNDPKKFTLEDFMEMKNWGKERLQELCDHLGTDPANFFEWLRTQIHSNYPLEKATQESDDLIRELFHRDPEENEFLPISTAYKYLARSILRIEPPTTQVKNGETVIVPNPQRKTVERLLARPERFLYLCQVYGLVKKEGNEYKSV